ncbi:MAG: hypothetical protein B7X04_03850 [Parcubacteria group bacterium 21-54-25]|nr:MAG: hypothetical protein B7X04_03850 [Parcubacteria group bacterium 21-54-25]
MRLHIIQVVAIEITYDSPDEYLKVRQVWQQLTAQGRAPVAPIAHTPAANLVRLVVSARDAPEYVRKIKQI